MKKPIQYFVILLVSALTFSCSSDDSNGGQSEPLTGDFFPSILDNIWTYDVNNASTSNPELNFDETDVVSVSSVNGDSYTLEVNNGAAPANGSVNAILSSGTLTKTESTLDFSGDIDILDQLGFTIDIDTPTLTDFTLYDLNADVDAEIANESQTTTNDVTLDGTTLPITITYVVTNTAKQTLSSLTVDGETFENVVNTEIKLNLAVSTTIDILGNPTTQFLLAPQDVAVIDNFYAEDIGLVRAVTNQMYNLNPTVITLLELGGVNLDIPNSASLVNTQDLTGYVLQ